MEIYLAKFILVHSASIAPSYIDLSPVPSSAIQAKMYRLVKAENLDAAKEIAHSYYKKQYESKQWGDWRLFILDVTEPLI